MEIKHECDFEALLLELADLYGVPLPSKSVCGLWWTVLEPYPWVAVEKALTDHVASCKFFPRPADVVERLNAEDGRPSPDEAWAVAVQALDETATVVWCQEITAAWGIALPVINTGDQVAARRTFLDAYTRLLSEARRLLAPVQYRALIRSRYRQHPGARQHLLADARRLTGNANCPAQVILGPYAREVRAILRALADRGRRR
jgi:hypothetical protein